MSDNFPLRTRRITQNRYPVPVVAPRDRLDTTLSRVGERFIAVDRYRDSLTRYLTSPRGKSTWDGLLLRAPVALELWLACA